MTDLQDLEYQLAQKNQFIEDLIKELSEAYDSVELIKDEVLAITLDFKCLIEALKNGKTRNNELL